MDINLDGAEIKIFVKLVSGQEKIVGKAVLSFRGSYNFGGESVGGAFETSGFRIWSGGNKRTGGEYRVTPPSYRAGSLGYKPYFFAFAFTDKDDQDEKKRLWYKLEDAILQAFEDRQLLEPREKKEGEDEEEINLDDIPL